MNVEHAIQKKSMAIEAILLNYLPLEEGYQKTVLEAVNYSMLAGGKRLRPMLMSETYELFGGRDKDFIEPFMAAMEMIHTYSLVHDDLPAMDNDEYRRGRKTTHVIYGEAMGILAGDALLNLAFDTAISSFETAQQKAYADEGEELLVLKRLAAALKILGEKPGIYGMIGGQAVDVENNDAPLKEEKLAFIYRLKTGALIEASMMIGAVLAGAGKTEIETVREAAEKIGLAFQIQDDILDVTSKTEILGKPVYSDEKNHKTTYVSLKGVEEAQKEVERVSREALILLDSLPCRNEFLRELILSLVNRKK